MNETDDFFNVTGVSSNMSSLDHAETSLQCSLRLSTEHFVLIFTFCTIFLLSVIGNSLVLLVILKQRTMRSITNIYLMNLAASDMMLSVVCMPPTLISMIMNCWVFGAYMCKVFAYLQPVVVTASAYTLAVIAFERYYAICKPLHSRIWQTRSHAYAMITLVWVVAITANGAMLFMYEQAQLNERAFTCAPIFSQIYIFINQCYITVVLLIVPLFIMTFLYGNVIRSLKTGIKLEITSVVEPTPSNGIAAATGPLKQSHSSHNLDSILVGSSTLARATSCIALFPPPPPPAASSVSTPFLTPTSIDDYKLQEQRRRSSGAVLLPPSAVVTSALPDSKLTIWQKLTNKLAYQPDKGANLEVNMSHRKSEASICLENPSLRSTHNQKSAMAKQRVIKMLIVVVIIFFCCWTPSYIYWLCLITTDTFQSLRMDIWNDRLNTVFTMLNYVSSCTNPITYCFLNKKFRNAVYATFGIRKKNMRNHFQKVYIPVNGGPANGKSSNDKPMINRSVSSTYIQQHQVVSNDPVTVTKNGTRTPVISRTTKNGTRTPVISRTTKNGTRTPVISRTVHASLIHHNNRIKSADVY
ncbi:unnamed protein product [Caenorhabditis angaria]|uniref:G-protein coupled receptors family 1 profile domain-containing protein n=1 Tax=Caenorhabditis angaria TaxID=860376 RepID=A0A9P1MYG5_9PELO|nr:unnamed protein product [Caenorhabditis angaria]